jgi:hypothetical protein
MPEQGLNKRVTKLEEKVAHLEHLNAPRQQNKTGESPQNASGDKGDPTPRQPATVKQTPAAPLDASESQQPWYKTIQGWYYMLAIIGIPFAIGYAFVTYLQWRDLRHNFEVDRRAWIKIKLDWDPSVPADTLVAKIVNLGKSVALRPRTTAMMQVVDAHKQPSFSLSPSHITVAYPLQFPNDVNDVPIALLAFPNVPRPLSGDERMSLLIGESYLVVSGVITYADAFGKHWTRFCFWQEYSRNLKAEFQARSCVDWNAVGDGDPPK